MRRLIVLLVAVVAGCKTSTPDPCAKISGTCINLTVTSHQVAAIDTILISAGDPINASTSSALGHSGTLPAHVAVTIPAAVSGTVHFDITGVQSAAPVGVGSFDSMLVSGRHVTASVDIEPTQAGGDGGVDDLATSADMPSSATVAARLIYPLSTSRVTNHRPHVRWQLPAGATNPQLDFCTSRACSQTIGTTTLDAGNLSGSPTADLAPGTVFWRVRTTGPGGDAVSATWSFTVQKAVKAVDAVDTSWGTYLDVNGDGRGDVVVGAPLATVKGVVGVGRVYIFHSNPTGFDASPIVLDGTGGMSTLFGTEVFSAGDLNGDGFADLVVLNTGKDAFVYHGGPNGILAGATPNTIIPAPTANATIAAAGDVNGDGYADLVVGPPQSGTPGSAYILFGGSSGVSKVAASIVDGSDVMMGSTSPQFGMSVSGAGDINADGYDDVIIGAPDQSHPSTANTGNAYVYLGGATKLTPFPQPPLADTTIGGFGTLVRGANDLDGDEYADVMVAVNGQTIETFLGGPTGFRTGPKLTDAQNGSGFASDPRTVAAVGDINGDGLDDVIVGAPSAFPPSGPGVPGAVHIFLASMSGAMLIMNDFGPQYGPDGDNGAFGIVTGIGDVNGDSRADVLIGASCAPANGSACGDGTAYLFTGQLNGLATVADQKWLGPDSHGSFGVVAALVRKRPFGRLRRVVGAF